ncbi:sex-specific storage-protein 1 precursor [Bombyx mori]|uniref:Methionine-rich storage protein n=1 Tax=Bombyx mori TaxID=7091 RepID=A0A8R1XG43_BOMMO|nr:sex-specific storage-protein 1 precursor [Bombyx mori]
MRVLVLLACLAAASATAISGGYGTMVFTKEPMVNLDMKMKELCIMKLLDHILQPTMFEDIKEIAKEYNIEKSCDKYMNVDVVKQFMEMYKMGMLPRGETFVHTNELQMEEAVKVFRVLYYAKDFDVFMRTACWMRERINGGMFVYAFTAACFHRTDCKGLYLPAPYEIYPYFFVDSHVISKAFMMKMTKAAKDPVLWKYYGITVTDDNLVVIDWRKGVRRSLSQNDVMSYFMEDVDLNTYMYYLHMNYPFWMTDDAYGINKERRGEIMMYANQQLLARMRLERLSHKMCDVKPMMWNEPLETGYWPKIRLPSGDEMPVRQNNMVVATKDNLKMKQMMDDVEMMIREGILTGKIERRDGTVISLKKSEDIENLARLVLGGLEIVGDDAKVIHLTNLMKKMLSYGQYNMDKYTYVPTSLDMYTTCLRDPVFWMIMKRVCNIFTVFKNMLPKYTREQFSFPGVKVEKITTDELVTFVDEYDMDISNAMYLDATEMQNKTSDMTFMARMRRLNHHPFQVSIDVMSDKTVDAVVRIFLGPKYDCMGRLMSVNDKRLDMFELDSFMYKLVNGKNTIVRSSMDMQGFIPEYLSTRRVMESEMMPSGDGQTMVKDWWCKSRNGFPQRLMLPLGTIGGLEMQMYVIVSPVRTGMLLPTLDMTMMKDRCACRWSSCISTMPLGYPFDRPIDMASFFTSNMKFADVMIYRKDLGMSNTSKTVDTSEMVMMKDDLTYLDSDMLVKRTYKDVMMMSSMMN